MASALRELEAPAALVIDDEQAENAERLAARVAGAAVEDGLKLWAAVHERAREEFLTEAQADAIIEEWDRQFPTRLRGNGWKGVTLSNGWKAEAFYIASRRDRRRVTDLDGYIMTRAETVKRRLMHGSAAAEAPTARGTARDTARGTARGTADAEMVKTRLMHGSAATAALTALPMASPMARTRPASRGAPRLWSIDQPVEAKYMAQTNGQALAMWFRGRIGSEPDAEGRCNVLYDDGDFEALVPSRFLRSPRAGTLQMPTSETSGSRKRPAEEPMTDTAVMADAAEFHHETAGASEAVAARHGAWTGICRSTEACVLQSGNEGGCKLGAMVEHKYEVERILDQRQRGRKVEYLIKWLHSPDMDSSWEPESALRACPEILAAWRPARPAPPARASSTRRSSSTAAEGLELDTALELVLSSSNETGFRGVFKKGGMYAARIWENGKPRHLGSFATAEEAALTYARHSGVERATAKASVIFDAARDSPGQHEAATKHEAAMKRAQEEAIAREREECAREAARATKAYKKEVEQAAKAMVLHVAPSLCSKSEACSLPDGHTGKCRKAPCRAPTKWIQCDRCAKWRVLPPHARETLGTTLGTALSTTLDEHAQWFCEMHPDESLARCDAPEEAEGESVVWEVGPAERERLAAAALAAAEIECLDLARTADGSYAHVVQRLSTQGTPYVAAVPRDAHGILDPMSEHHGQLYRELGAFATREEAALASARFVLAYQSDHAALVPSLLGDQSGGASRATLVGQRLDFYWPIDDVWYDATCVAHLHGTRYEMEWTDDHTREQFCLAVPTYAWRLHRDAEAGSPSSSEGPGRGMSLLDIGESEDVEAIAAKEGLTLLRLRGDTLVGQRIKVHWPLDKAWYVAVVTGYSHETKKTEVRYVDDDAVEALDLEKEEWRLDGRHTSRPSKGALMRVTADADSSEHSVKLLASLAEYLENCGGSTEMINGWFTKTQFRKEGGSAGTGDSYFFTPQVSGSAAPSCAQPCRSVLSAHPPHPAPTYTGQSLSLSRRGRALFQPGGRRQPRQQQQRGQVQGCRGGYPSLCARRHPLSRRGSGGDACREAG